MITKPKETYSHCKAEADKWFSLWLRVSYADYRGFIACSCGCGKALFWKEMQASHYINRDNMTTRYHEQNVVPATRECNYYDEGHQTKIARFINKRFGMYTTLELNALGHSQIKFMRHELIEIADKYKHLYQELKKEKGL